MKIQENFDLTSFNTFGVKASTRFFAELSMESEIPELLASIQFKTGPVIFLGGGSNTLFTKDWPGLVVLNRLKGINIEKEDGANVYVKSMGGEDWHDLVLFSVSNGFWGLENLSLIPGSVGASPIQNIGAYGVELKDILESVEVFDLHTGEKKVFSNSECCFGYRDSIFKNDAKGKYFISAIVVKLSKIPKPNTEYRALKEYLEQNSITELSLKNISEAVISIRKSKLPDPKVLGNAGSFFKNVFINEEEFRELQQKFPDVPYFREEDKIKIPAGWLIESCGFKGKRFGNVGMHEKQALVLVNYEHASGEEIQAFANTVISKIKDKFGLTLVPEVNFV